MCLLAFMQCKASSDDAGILPVAETPETPVKNAPEPEYRRDSDVPADEPMDDDILWSDVECFSSAITGEAGKIVGKWQLMKDIRENDTTDRSCENRVYHFKADRTLTVYVDGTKTEEYGYYNYDGYPFCPACLPYDPKPNLVMGDAGVYGNVQSEHMIIYPESQFKTVFTEAGQNEMKWLLPIFDRHENFLRIE